MAHPVKWRLCVLCFTALNTSTLRRAHTLSQSTTFVVVVVFDVHRDIFRSSKRSKCGTGRMGLKVRSTSVSPLQSHSGRFLCRVFDSELPLSSSGYNKTSQRSRTLNGDHCGEWGQLSIWSALKKKT